MWEKIKSFFSRFGTLIGIVIGAVGVLFTTRRTDSDFDRLRADNEELRRELRELKRRLEWAIAINELSEQETQQLRESFSDAERQLEQSISASGEIGDDIKQLSDTNRRLREWIRKYGKTIVSLEDTD